MCTRCTDKDIHHSIVYNGENPERTSMPSTGGLAATNGMCSARIHAAPGTPIERSAYGVGKGRSRSLPATPTPPTPPDQPLPASCHLATLNVCGPHMPRLALFSGIRTCCPLCLQCHSHPPSCHLFSSWLTPVQPLDLAEIPPVPPPGVLPGCPAGTGPLLCARSSPCGSLLAPVI